VCSDVPPPLAQRLKGRVALHPLTSQASVAIDLVVVVEYLELQGLKLYRDHSYVSTQLSERASPRRRPKRYPIPRWFLVVGSAVAVGVCSIPGRRTAAGAWARLVGAEVHVVGDAVAVPVSNPGVRTAAGPGAGLVGAGIVPIANPVTVPVGAAAGLGAWLIGTVVIPVANSIAVPIGAASVRGHAWLVGALILRIGDAVAVQVPWRWTAIMLGQARFIGAGVFGVAYPVFIGVGATIGQR
jgi:hypothetical protein